jgi:surface protein
MMGGKKSFLIEGRFVILIDTEQTGVSTSTQFEFTGAEVSTGTTFPVTFSPELDPFNYTDVTVDVSVSRTITLPSAGRYYVQVGQPFRRIVFNNVGDRLKVVSAPLQWGNIVWSSFENAFRGCANMDGTNANDVPDLSSVTNMFGMFLGATAFNQDIGGWDVSSVTNMIRMFNDATAFNQDINGWDVSSVTNMANMFNGTTAFNQNLGDWNLNANVDLGSMLNSCGMNTANYSLTLMGWANDAFLRGVPINRSLGATGRTYNNTVRATGLTFNDAVSARTFLTTAGTPPTGAGWTISGDSDVS